MQFAYNTDLKKKSLFYESKSIDPICLIKFDPTEQLVWTATSTVFKFFFLQNKINFVGKNRFLFWGQ